MNTKAFVAGGAVCLALAVAGPAAAAPRGTASEPPQGQALYPETVPGAGLSGVAGAQATIRHIVSGHGFTGAASFRIDLRRPAAGLRYVDPTRQIAFRSLEFGSVRFVENTATLRGVGIVNHRRVPFTAFAAHNALAGVDVFRIAWSHGAGHGGRVVRGSVFIR